MSEMTMRTGTSPWTRLRQGVAVLAMLWLAACANVPPGPLPQAVDMLAVAAASPASAAASSNHYLLTAGDELDIKVPDASQYDQSVRVRPDGKVSLHLVGTVHVAGRSAEDVQAEVRERYQVVAGGQKSRAYLLQAGDEIEVKFPFMNQLNELVRIRPDGKVQLQLAGLIQAEGLSPEALQAELKQRYARFLRQPELSVILRSATSQVVQTDQGPGRAGLSRLQPSITVKTFQAMQVYVAGEALKPGMYPYQSGMSLMQALAQAGGHLPTADIPQIVVVRRTPQGGAEVIRPQLTKTYLAAPDRDVLLQPFDVVLLPPSQVALLGQNLDQYLFKILPPLRNSAFGFVYNFTPTRN